MHSFVLTLLFLPMSHTLSLDGRLDTPHYLKSVLFIPISMPFLETP